MLQAGARVEIEDSDRDADRFERATVVAAETRFVSYIGYEVPGYVVRYDNECEVWVRDWRVRALRVADVDGRPIVERDRVEVVAGELAGKVGTVQVTRPASGTQGSHHRIPASVMVNLDGGPGLDCNADMVRVIAGPAPVTDANGDRVAVPATVTVNGDLRHFMAGRVPARGCPHYISVSEATAGFTTCERCYRTD